MDSLLNKNTAHCAYKNKKNQGIYFKDNYCQLQCQFMSIRGEVLFLAHKNAARCIGEPKQKLVNSGGRDWANWSDWWD